MIDAKEQHNCSCHIGCINQMFMSIILPPSKAFSSREIAHVEKPAAVQVGGVLPCVA
jgi:hypothetical protein